MSNAFTADVSKETPPVGGFYIRKYLQLVLDCLPKNNSSEAMLTRKRVRDILETCNRRLCNGCGEWRSECVCDRRLE